MRTAKGKEKVKTTKETVKHVNHRKLGKRKALTEKATKREIRKEKKAKKDPNKPKKSLSAFFVFIEDFWQTFKKENPTVKAVSAVGDVS